MFDAGDAPVNASNFTVRETGDGAAPTVAAVDASGNPTIVVTLSRIITIQEWTTVRVGVDFADTDRNAAISPFDLLAFRQLINGVSPPATQSWSVHEPHVPVAQDSRPRCGTHRGRLPTF